MPPGQTFCITLYFTLHYLQFDMPAMPAWLCLYKMNFGPFGAIPHWSCPQGSHQNSECVPPVLIHWAITCDSFKFLAKKPKRSWVTIKKSDQKSYVSTSNVPQTCPRCKRFAPLYSTLHYLLFDMQHDYVCTKWILDPSGPNPRPCPQGSHQNSECVPLVLIHRATTCDSFKVLAIKA